MALPRNVVLLTVSILLIAVATFVVAPPPKRPAAPPPGSEPKHPDENDNDAMNKFEYDRYLQEVVKALEKDPKFMAKLSNASEDYIKSGQIAEHMDELGIDVRDELHEIKRREIDRLRDAVQKQIELEGHAGNVKMPEHLDVVNMQKFEKDDLRKLIDKTTKDIDELDRKRKEKFKDHELKKRADYDHQLQAAKDAEERKRLEEAHKQQQKRHNEHEKMKHPGGKEQLEEVWKETDKMEEQPFDPRTFFSLHDYNGDGLLDRWELDALFQNELDKVYNESNPDDDPKERYEEMARMQEHVMKQMDKDKDGMISLKEFMEDPEVEGEKKAEDWQTIDEEPQYTDEELKRFEEEYFKQNGWEIPTQPHQPPELQHAQQQVHPDQQHQQQQVPNQQHPQAAGGAQIPQQAVHPAAGQVRQQVVHPAGGQQPVVPHQAQGQAVNQQAQVPQQRVDNTASQQQQQQAQPVQPDRSYGI